MIEVVTESGAAAAAARVEQAARVAVDTEFHAENRYGPDLYLVQLGLPDGTVLLLDPLLPGVLGTVGRVLLTRPWVLHAGEQDLRVLAQALGGEPTQGVFDTQIAAGLVSPLYPAGYATLCSTWLGAIVDKAETLSDWSRRPLSQSQLAYAAADVRHLFALADRLRDELDRRGRAQQAEAAMADAVEHSLRPSPDRWLSEITAGTTLTPEQANVLRALMVWRDERARAANLPPRVVSGDGVLVDLARRMPRTVGEMTASRRFPKHVARLANELCGVLEEARATAPETWPNLVRRNTPEARRSAFLQLWAQVVGERESWAAGLVLPREIADGVALGGVLQGWRAQLADRELAEVLAGTVALRWTGGDPTCA